MWRVATLLVLIAACGSSSSGGDDDDTNLPPPLTADEAATACVFYGSCLGDGINDCYTDAMPHWSTTEARCVLAAGADCVAVRACFGMSIVADPSCTTKSTTCDGANLVSCADGTRATISCPDASLLLSVGVGPTCVTTSTGALCGKGTCSAASATCNGSVAEGCVVSKGVELSIDCAQYGQTCVAGACTAPGGGGACSSSTTTCDGSAIVRCSSGVEIRTDCAAIGVDALCYPGTGTSSTTEPYCGFGNACYPEKGTESCNGNSVMFCAAGVTATIDCTTLGFTRCFAGRCSAF